MSHSDDSGQRTAPGGIASLVALSHYDFILAVIPVALLLGVLGSSVGGVPVEGAMAVGALIGGLAVLDALFVHAPTDA